MSKEKRLNECYEYLAIGVKRLQSATTDTEVDSMIEHIEFWSEELRLVQSDDSEASSTQFMVSKHIYS